MPRNVSLRDTRKSAVTDWWRALAGQGASQENPFRTDPYYRDVLGGGGGGMLPSNFADGGGRAAARIPGGGIEGSPAGAGLPYLPGGPGPDMGLGGAGGGFRNILGRIFNRQTGIDPTLAILGMLRLVGGGDGEQRRQSFRNAGGVGSDMASLIDPLNAMYNAMQAVSRTGQGLSERGPVRLRSSVVPAPRPVQVAGVPFQIGGGLGRDPALDDPSLLEFDPYSAVRGYDPFQSLPAVTGRQPEEGFWLSGASEGSTRNVRRRNPGG